MGLHTNIAWCDSTINPTSGCDGCELWTPGVPRPQQPCYAGRLHENRLAVAHPRLYAPRFTEVRLIPGRMAKAAAWTDLTGKLRADKPHLDGLPRVIFIGDMGDTLSRAVPFEFLKTEIIDVVTSPPGRRHIWMWLTKRPARLMDFETHLLAHGIPWPANLWPGTTITTQATSSRVRDLLQVDYRNRALPRFISAEPLWGRIDLSDADVAGTFNWLSLGIHLVITGDQSGRDPRPTDPAWHRHLLDQCIATGTSFFNKQMRVGGQITTDLADFPEDLRIRQFPQPLHTEAACSPP